MVKVPNQRDVVGLVGETERWNGRPSAVFRSHHHVGSVVKPITEYRNDGEGNKTDVSGMSYVHFHPLQH